MRVQQPPAAVPVSITVELEAGGPSCAPNLVAAWLCGLQPRPVFHRLELSCVATGWWAASVPVAAAASARELVERLQGLRETRLATVHFHNAGGRLFCGDRP